MGRTCPASHCSPYCWLQNSLLEVKKTRKQGMFLLEVQLYHIWSLKPDLLSFHSSVCLPLFYEKKREIYRSFFGGKGLWWVLWRGVGWGGGEGFGCLINHRCFHRRAACTPALHTPGKQRKQACISAYMRAEQTSHVEQLRSNMCSTKRCHWQPKTLWKPPLADLSPLWFCRCKRDETPTRSAQGGYTTPKKK